MRQFVLAVVLASAAWGCDEQTPTGEAQAPAAAQAAPKRVAPVGWKRPALARPEGSSEADAAVVAAQTRVESNSKDLDAWTALGNAWVRKARRDQKPRYYSIAGAIADHVLSESPNATKATHLAALVAREGHDFAKMRSLSKGLLDRDEADVNAWGLLGDAELELGNIEGAVLAYQNMIDLRPGIPAYSRVAYVRWLSGDIDGAQQMWEQCAKTGGPSDPEPLAYCLTQAGHVEWHRAELDKAATLYDAALNLVPGYADALLGRGRTRLARGDMEEAVDDLRASLQTRRLEDTYIWLAAALRKAGEVDEAQKMEDALASGTAHDDPRTVALYLATRNLEPERALQLAERDASQRGDVFTHDTLAMAHLRTGDTAEAQKHIAEALALNTPDARLYAHAGLIAAAAGDDPAAAGNLQKAFDMNPHLDPYLVDEARSVLARIQDGQ